MISQTFVVIEEGTITYKINASKIHRQKIRDMRQSLLAAMTTVDLLMASYTYNKLIAS